MLTLLLPATDSSEETLLHLEHSLVSVSKWEEITERPFFGHEKKTEDDMRQYVELMILDPVIPEDFLERLQEGHGVAISNYISAKRSATWFNEIEKPDRRVITSEVIYSWMVGFRIPFECQYWHCNRLLTLIRVCGQSREKPKKMSRPALREWYHQLNEQRKAQLGTSG